jgi:hypothetical protein
MRRNGTQRWIAVLSILTAFTLLFSFAASAQPVLAVYPPPTEPGHPTVNGLYWGDGDGENYYGNAIAFGVDTDSRLYKFVDPEGTPDRRLYVTLVIDGNFNDNAFDRVVNKELSAYMESAGWPKYRTAKSLMDSEYATFSVDICGQDATWVQGYARQFEGITPEGVGTGSELPISFSNNTSATWVSDHTITTGSGTPPDGFKSSSSIVWNLNNYATTPQYNMDVRCDAAGVDPCYPTDWKSPFSLDLPLPGDTVTTTGGFPAVISSTNRISHSVEFQWEWAMVYEWSVPVPMWNVDCDPGDILVTTGDSHHSPSKLGFSEDPTPVTLVALGAANSTALLPIAGLLVGSLGTVIVAPRRRRRRH